MLNFLNCKYVQQRLRNCLVRAIPQSLIKKRNIAILCILIDYVPGIFKQNAIALHGVKRIFKNKP